MRLGTWADSITGSVRPTNQDAIGSFADLGLFIVADGMGGRSEGEIASALAVDTLREVHQNGASGDAAEYLRTAIALANDRVFALGRARADLADPARAPMGTTIVALHCSTNEERVHWAHVGDSRLYRSRAGDLALLTADHTRPGEPYWSSEHVPLDLPHTNRLIHGLGLTPTVPVPTRSETLRPGDVFLLCSDGVSGAIAPETLGMVLREGAGLDAMGARLLELSLAAGGRDNASVVLVRSLPD